MIPIAKQSPTLSLVLGETNYQYLVDQTIVLPSSDTM
jgi:hypothetical protein